LSRIRARKGLVALSVLAAIGVAAPAASFGQASAGNGSAASEYGDYVPTTSGTGSKHASSSKPHRTSSAPARHYTPPVRHYVAPSATNTTSTPRTTVTRSAPGTSSAPVHKAKRHPKRHRPHHAAAAHKTKAGTPAPAKPRTTVPAAPAASVDGGSGQLVLLGLAMLTMTVAVFTRAGVRRRHGSV